MKNDMNKKNYRSLLERSQVTLIKDGLKKKKYDDERLTRAVWLECKFREIWMFY